MSAKPYRDYKSFLIKKFGCKVHKVTVDAGMTCPNRDGTVGFGGCIYCNSRGSGTGAFAKGIPLNRQITDAIGYLRKRYKAEKFLAYFQSFSNTYAPLGRLKQLYKEALSVDDVVGLTIGTRPDCIDEEILQYLEWVANKWYVSLEYGLQSAHDKTLKLINRGHGVKEFVAAVELTRNRNIDICVHVILGLPGETEDDMLETAKFLSELDIQAVKIHLLYVVKNTVLEKWYREGKYRCLTREEYTRIVSRFIAFLRPDIVIQRITGDPHRNELVAPLWSLEKQRNIQEVINYMEKNSLKQGSLLGFTR